MFNIKLTLICVMSCLLINQMHGREWHLTNTKEKYQELTEDQKTRIFLPTYSRCTKENDIRYIPHKKTMSPKWSPILYHNVFLEDEILFVTLTNIYHTLFNESTSRQLMAAWGVLLFLVYCTLMLLAFMVIGPILGYLAFHILWVIYNILTCSWVRKSGRFLIIKWEQFRRKRHAWVTPYQNQHCTKLSTDKFKLNRFFRNYPGEEIPEELLEKKESKGEIPYADKFFRYQKKSKTSVEVEINTEEVQEEEPQVQTTHHHHHHHHHEHQGEAELKNKENNEKGEKSSDNNKTQKRKSSNENII